MLRMPPLGMHHPSWPSTCLIAIDKEVDPFASYSKT